MQPNACTTKKISQDMSSSSGPNSNANGNQEITAVLKPTLQVAGLAGVSGFFVGAVSGILRSTTPFLFAMASGIQWSALGGTFWGARSAILGTRGNIEQSDSQLLAASTMAGGLAGTMGGFIRGRRNVIPGAIVFALLGGLGQGMHNLGFLQGRGSNVSSAEKGRSWLDSKWSPMKILTDEDYMNMLEEKLLKVNVEIALVDDNIASLKKREQTQHSKKPKEESSGS